MRRMRGSFALWAFASLAVLGATLMFLRANGSVLAACFSGQDARRQQCIAEALERSARAGDFAATFELVAQAYARDADFAANCHGNAHEIGKAAYERFSHGETLRLTPRASYCGYGFYHGFMEDLLSTEGDPAGARAFCRRVGEELREEAPDSEGACYHGLGHGAVDGTDPRQWGNPRAMAAEGLRLCALVAGNLPDIPAARGPLYRCTTGAYNALEILSQNTKYRLAELTADPFAFCEGEPPARREGCYTNMLPAVMRNNGNDFQKTVATIAGIPGVEHSARQGLVTDLFHEYVRLHVVADNPGGVEGREKGAALCRSLREDFQTPCIEGLAGGELKYGEPKREYVGLFALCTDTLSGDREAQAACFGFGLPRLANIYGPASLPAVCAQAPREYRGLCRAGE